jgi:hypothetical protein
VLVVFGIVERVAVGPILERALAGQPGGHLLGACVGRFCAYRLIGPGSEWRLHREWFDQMKVSMARPAASG